jgi:PPP family 3-phenylpropionic acid transporter
MRMVWPFTVNVLLFASGACVFPFFVLYYQSLGFTGTQIGLITGLTPLITLVSAPLWTNLADATRRHRLLMSVLILAAALVVSAFPFFRTFGPVLVIAVIYAAAGAPVISFADNATMATLGDEKALYGRVRLGGTFGFGVAALLVGFLVEGYGIRMAFWMGGALQLLALLASQPLTHRAIKSAEVKAGRVTDLFADRRWLPFLMLAFAAGLGFAVSNTYLFPYMEELGASTFTMGLALTLATVAEVPVFFFGNRLIERFRPFSLLLLAMLLSGARLVFFVFATTPEFVLFLQFLNGLTFPVLWLAGVAYADEHAPPGMGATAQGMFSATVFGFGAAVGGLTAGLLLEYVGGRGMFLSFGVTVLAIVAVVALFHRQLSGRVEQRVAGSV